MSLDDLLGRSSQEGGADAGPVVKRVDRASPQQTKVTRAEELRLQLADEIIRGALAPGAALDETDIARRFNVSRTPVRANIGIHTQPISFIGLPVVAVPVPLQPMPIGVQIIAAPWREDIALRVAHALERMGVVAAPPPGGS